ncbi:MAG TPA: TolC family outer membrane protein [Steroidobacteraceae bacterium]|nr:TolC family outer membrane protein [Steroidobacteraceae bacterium]
MNTRFLVRAILAAASLAAVNASAADLKEVYTRALTSDPLIREADANRLATRESKPQAVASLLPQIAANASELKNESVGSQTVIDIDEVDGEVTIGSVERETKGTRQVWNVELRQSIFRWQNWAELKRSDVEGAQAEAEYVVAQQDLIVRTAEAYFNVLAARDTLEAAQAAHDAIGRQLEQSEKRFEVGLIAVTDVQDAKAAYDSATAALIQGKRNLANSGELLRELTGDAWDALDKPGNDMPLAGPDPASPEDWVKLAMDQNARLTASRLAADVTRQVVNIERGGYFPEIDFIVTRGDFDDDGNFTDGGGTTFPNDADSEDTTYGVQVTLPIFTGGATTSRVRQAQYRNIAARERLERTVRETERSTRDAYLGVNSEVARVQSLKQAVESAQTALQATEAGYEVGTRTSVDVLQARQRLFQSQTDYARSRYDYLLNVLRLQQAAGTLDNEGLDDINALLTENVTVR